jgi:Flp pilus assembly pilin Flp
MGSSERRHFSRPKVAGAADSSFRRWRTNVKVKRLIRALSVKDAAGQAMVEYALILALVAAVSIGTLKLFAAPVNNVFQLISSAL